MQLNVTMQIAELICCVCRADKCKSIIYCYLYAIKKILPMQIMKHMCLLMAFTNHVHKKSCCSGSGTTIDFQYFQSEFDKLLLAVNYYYQQFIDFWCILGEPMLCYYLPNEHIQLSPSTKATIFRRHPSLVAVTIGFASTLF